MVSLRRFGALAVASVIAIALISLEALPVAAAVPKAPKSVSADQLDPLDSPEQATRDVSMPEGDFNDTPTFGGAVKQGSAFEQSSPGGQSRRLIRQEVDRDVFDNGDGTETVEMYFQPINTKGADGKWRKVDNSLEDDGNGRLRNRAGDMKSTFGKASDDAALLKVESGDHSLSFKLDDAKSGKKRSLKEQKVRFDDVMPGTNIEYQVGSSQVKEIIEVSDRASVQPVYRFSFSGKGVSASDEGDRGIVFKDKKGDEIFQIPDGFAWDSSPGPQMAPVDVRLSKNKKQIEVVPDPTFLETAAYPIRIDPEVDLKAFNSNSYDAYTSSGTPTANYNGGSQSDGVRFLDRAGLHPGVADYNSHIKFDLGQYAGRQVVNATFNSHVFSREDGTNPLCIYPIATNNSWNPDTVTWNTRPNHWGDCNNVSDPNKIRVSPVIGDNAYDITTWVRNWSSGVWQNNGMTLDTAGQAGHYKFGAFEQFTSTTPQAHYPYIRLTYNTLPTPSNPTEPLNNERVMSATPTLKATSATDEDPGDTVEYWFRLSTTSDPEIGQITNSGWLENPQWQVPDGALQDGATYSWYVFSKDPDSLNGAYTVSQHKWKFRVNKGFGVQGSAPNDTVGPLNVNLANGNVTTEISSPMFKTVGGDVGVKYSYNSKDTNKFGLKGEYFDGCANGQVWPQEVRATRTDAQIDMHWDQIALPSQPYPGIDQWNSTSGSPAPGVNYNDFCARWSGYVTVPSQGSWCFDVVSDDGARLKFDDSQNWLFERWTVGVTSNADFTNKCVTFDAGRTKKVKIEHFDSTGGAHAILYAAPAGDLNAKTIVPASWLSTTTNVLPEGWRLSVDTDTGVQYSRATINSQSITLHEPNGAAHEYRQSNATESQQTRLGFIPPPEERSIITKRDNSYVVDAEDGLTYQFNQAGALTDVRSKVDASKPAAAVLHYDGTGRLIGMQDPVSTRQINFTYGKAQADSSCPDPDNSSFARAPVGQLCKIKYWDNTETTLLYDSSDPAQLKRIIDPGVEVTDLGYAIVDTDPGTATNDKLVLNRISEPLAQDWIADDVNARGGVEMRNDVSTLVTYASDGNFKATQIERPFPNPYNKGPQPRPVHSYTYGANRTGTVKVAGTSTNPNHVDAAYTWDIGGRTTQATDGAGIMTVSGYDQFDQPTYVKNLQTGRMLASRFDVEGRVIETNGPAPATCFDGANPPNRVTLVPGCGESQVPKTTTKFDTGFAGGNNGLSASYWNNTGFVGSPVKHDYFTQNTGGKLQFSWGAGSPADVVPADNWTGRFTGRIALVPGNSYTFSEATDDGVRVYIDDRLVISNWPGETSPLPVTVTAQAANDGNVRSERIRIDYMEVTGGATLGVKWSVNGGAADFIPISSLTPNFGLVTETHTHDLSTEALERPTLTQYVEPALGMATTTIEDAGTGGANLMSSTKYEEPDGAANHFLRRIGRTLPGGNSYRYEYYDNTTAVDDPCKSGTDLVNQGGALWKTWAASPQDGSGTGVTTAGRSFEENKYDAAGRTVWSKHSADANPTCISYDDRGRVTSKTVSKGGADERVVTYNYKTTMDSSPVSSLVTSVGDSSGAIYTKVDLLGQVVEYRDAKGNLTSYNYDQAGRVTSSNGVNTKDFRQFSYDEGGRLTEQKVGESSNGPLTTVAAPTYTNGELSSVNYGANGTSQTVTRDTYARLTKLEYKKGGTIFGSDEVTRSQSGKVIVERIDGELLADANLYSYDGAGRLIRGKVDTGDFTFSFGAPSVSDCNHTGDSLTTNLNTNRTSVSKDGVVVAKYCYDIQDRITSSTDSKYAGGFQYDGRGNAIKVGDMTLEYDAADRHMKTTLPDGTSVTYVRDALDRIIERYATSPAQAGPTTPTYRASATNTTNGATSLTVNRPVNTQTGDVLFAHVVVNTGTSTISAPSGWTQLTTTNNSQVRSSAFWRVAAAGDPSSWNFTFDGSYQASGGIAAYAGVNQASPVDDWNQNVSASAGTSWHTWDALTSQANEVALVFSGVKNTTNVTPHSSQTERWEVSSSGGTSNTRAQSQMSDAPVAATNTWFRGQGTLAASSHWTGQVYLLKPAGSAGGGGGTPTTPTYRASATNTSNGATSLTVNRPTGTQTGDVMFAHIVVNTGTSTISAPSGWTQIATTNNAQVRSSAFWRVATASDPSSFSFTFDGSYQASGGIAAYGGVDQTNPVDDWNQNDSASAGTSWHTWDALTSQANDVALVFSGVKNTTNVTPHSSQTERWEVSSSGGAATTHAQSQMSDAPVANANTWFRGQGTLAASSDWTAEVILLKPGATSGSPGGTTTTDTMYAYSGDGDTAEATKDANGIVLDKNVSLPGGVLLTVKWTNNVAEAKYNYPNIHGDIAYQADANGNQIGTTKKYDPFGQPLNDLPDNEAGNFDYGWLGQHQRQTEHEGLLNVIEMGARQYLPNLGRFLQVDPVDGGSANDYDYVYGDPVNGSDLDGTRASFSALFHQAIHVVTSTVFKKSNKHFVKRKLRPGFHWRNHQRRIEFDPSNRWHYNDDVRRKGIHLSVREGFKDAAVDGARKAGSSVWSGAKAVGRRAKGIGRVFSRGGGVPVCSVSICSQSPFGSQDASQYYG
jgi:RHS repeat-associated protein